jgi:hypothetical protein
MHNWCLLPKVLNKFITGIIILTMKLITPGSIFQKNDIDNWQLLKKQ